MTFKPAVFKFGHPPDGLDVVWSADIQSYSYVVDADREEYGFTEPKLELTWHQVERRTPKCAVISGFLERIYAKRCKFRETPEEALMSLKSRRERQIKILTSQLERAKYELTLNWKGGDE